MPQLIVKKESFQNNVRQLGKVIKTFNGAAYRFEKYYQHLEKKIQELKLELKIKNDSLEKNLKEKEEVKDYLNNILESLTVGVIVVDLKGRITTFNHAAEEITGITVTHAKGNAFDNIITPLFVSENVIDFKLLKTFSEHTAIETDLQIDIHEILTIRLSVTGMKNSYGKKNGLLITIHDITDMKKLEKRANRSDRLAAMGEMAAKIAHEIRNPLGSMELFCSTLKKELEGSVELHALTEHILSGSKSISNIISNLLLFIKPQQKPKFQAIDIYNPLNDSLFFSSHLLKTADSIEVVKKYEHGPLKIKGDVELLKQAFLNLILNAIQAMAKGGTLTISSKKVKRPDLPGKNVEIKIADTGTGISSVYLSRIFDPFFTLKERGTGLGLSIVNNIIVLHGGTIDVRSKEGEGSVCIITLPLWEENNRRSERKNENCFFKEVTYDDTPYTCC